MARQGYEATLFSAAEITMPDEHWRKVQSLFMDALHQTVGERVAFLDRACGEDSELREEVESLLEHDTMARAEFLEPPKPSQPCPIIEPDFLVGTRIGQYEVKRVIGSGGMGTVYEAEQQRPKRLVALKVVKTHLPSRSLFRRLEFESEVLARLQHPHIAQVFEAGAHRDSEERMLPFFAMEYVEGAQPITTYAKKNKLGARECIALFLQACEAVDHGHQKGVIHRDLKPANILVDSRGQVKVIDFGVARATDSDVAVTTIHTSLWSLIGTLQYMSPEQCEGDPLGLDIRSDIYSLGVILYELLAGQLPYDVRGRSIPSATRTICDSEPSAPSTIDRRLRGDLEVIILTAMEKERSKRYQAAGALATDLQLYLRHEPISARPRSRWTKVAHWAGRHPRAATVIVSLIIALGIIGGTTTATWYLNFEPRQIAVAQDGSAAFLLSVADRRLHRWPSAPGGIHAIPELLDPPQSLNAGRLAIIGYTCMDQGLFGKALCAYDVDADRDLPLWKGVIQTDDLPSILTKRGMTGSEFHVDAVAAADIFAEEPGVEVIALHKQESVTSSALRVYSLQGAILYQVWLDVHVKAIYWLPLARQLVLAGSNGRAFWSERGHPEIKRPQHPFVVFAIPLTLNFRSGEYIVEEPGDGPLRPVWYQCIGQPKAQEFIRAINLMNPAAADDLGRNVRLNLALGKSGECGYDVLVDDLGQEVPGSRRTAHPSTSAWDELPSPDSFALQKLPPPEHDIPYGSAPE